MFKGKLIFIHHKVLSFSKCSFKAKSKGAIGSILFHPKRLFFSIKSLFQAQYTIEGRFINKAIASTPSPFSVGASKRDITPPPGYPMGGFSVIGKTALGSLGRLYARSIVIQDTTGKLLAMCSTDLWSLPEGLGNKVLETLQQHHIAIHRSQLIISATHTHASPGNFSSSPVYNAFGSPQPGFDPDLFHFLVIRISQSIEQAIKRLEPAIGYIKKENIFGVSLNRSLKAYKQNPESTITLEKNKKEEGGSLPESSYAIDPTLRVICYHSASFPKKLLCIAGFFGVHNTVMGPNCHVYSADLFGSTNLYIENKLGPETVIALFNGAQGDISPHYEAQNKENCLRLGYQLGDHILDLITKDSLKENFESYQFAYDRSPLQGVCIETDQGLQKTPNYPMMGASQLGGTRDGQTIFYDWGWEEGLKGHEIPGHGIKPHLLNKWGKYQPKWITSVLTKFNPESPTHAPLSIYQLSPTFYLVPIPGEFSATLLKRYENSLRKTLSEKAEIQFIGLSNEYLSYFSTPEEYDAQHYEGASNMYGRASSAIILHYLHQLTEKLSPTFELTEDRTKDFHFNAGPPTSFGNTAYQSELTDLVPLLSSCLNHPEQDLLSTPGFSWEQDYHWPLSDLEDAIPSVTIENFDIESQDWAPLTINGIDQNNHQENCLTILLSKTIDKGQWIVFWQDSSKVAIPLTIRFTVNNRIHSEPFHINPE